MNIDRYRDVVVLGVVISALVVPIPDTNCSSCKYHEYTKFQKVCLGYPNSGGIGSVMRIAMGAVPYDSYAYHRQLWIENGALMELGRMLRHVTTTEN